MNSTHKSPLMQSIDTIQEQGMLSPFIVHSFLDFEKERKQQHESNQSS